MQVKYAYTIIRSSLSQCNLGFYMVIKGITIHVFFSSCWIFIKNLISTQNKYFIVFNI